MKASELVEQLQEQIANFGDNEVIHENNGLWYVDSVHMKENFSRNEKFFQIGSSWNQQRLSEQNQRLN
jgi:hypothetical protein